MTQLSTHMSIIPIKLGKKPKVGLKHICRWGSGAEVCFFLSQDLEQWLVPN